MSRQFTATILLEHPWMLDVDALAEAVAKRFPALGAVDGIQGQRGAHGGVLAMDGASVVIEAVAHRAPPDLIRPPQDILRDWDPKAAIDGHRAHIHISCGGRLQGLDGAMSYAAAVMFATSGALDIVPARAVLWCPSWAITTPEAFCDATEALFEGRMPVSTWVSFVPYVPPGYAPEAATGMATVGLNRLLGRELDLAPRPGSTEGAHEIVTGITRRVLEEDMLPRGGTDIVASPSGLNLTVRKRDCWLKRDQSAFVLMAQDSVIDRETLKPLAASAA